MSKKLLFIILLISLAFNLAFIGSFLYWRHQFRCDYMKGPNHREMMENRNRHGDMMHHRNGPDDDQPPPPPGLRRGDMGWMGNKKIVEPYRIKFDESKVEFFKALQQPVVNEEVLKQKLQTSLQNHTELEKQIGLRLIEMRKKMTAQQANEFFGRHARNAMRHDKDIQDRQPKNTQEKRRTQ